MRGDIYKPECPYQGTELASTRTVMAPHSSTLAWKIPQRRSLVVYSPWGCKRVRHDLVTKTTAILDRHGERISI